jgi:hypothetical protein
MKKTTLAAPMLIAAVGAAAGTAAAQAPITVINGFDLQSWNAGTSTPNRVDWAPERGSTGWANGLRWNWQTSDGMIPASPVIPMMQPVFDESVPGITGAYKFPEAKATTFNLDDDPTDGIDPTIRGAWETQAQPGEAGTFELWFKPMDLEGSHVLWEIGATNKGVAFALDGDELVFAVEANDGEGGNVASVQYRHQLTETRWHQAVIVIDLFSFAVRSYVDGVEVDSQAIPPAAEYRWAGGNPAGLGMLGGDPAAPSAGIAGDAVPVASLTDYDGWISTMRFYDVDLFDDEVLDNYNALTDSDAAARRGDFNGDDSVDDTDQFDYVSFMASTDTTPVAPFQFPFPHQPEGGVFTGDPFMDEGYVGDFAWDRDDGWLAGNEPTFQFPAINVLEPVPVLEPSIPSIRTAFVLNGVEAFRGPKFEWADDTTAVHTLFWLYVDDLTGNHCLFEAGGSGVGYSIVTRGDEIAGYINTAATDGNDILEITSGPGVLQTGWHRFDVVVRRFVGGGLGQGFELYMDGQQVAAANNEPGPDGEFGTPDDIIIFNPEGPANTNFIGGNQAGYGQVFGTAALPFGWEAGDVSPFNGLAGPFRLIQAQPLPADIAASFAADATQNVMNGRGDLNADGAANFLDVLEQLRLIDGGR